MRATDSWSFSLGVPRANDVTLLSAEVVWMDNDVALVFFPLCFMILSSAVIFSMSLIAKSYFFSLKRKKWLQRTRPWLRSNVILQYMVPKYVKNNTSNRQIKVLVRLWSWKYNLAAMHNKRKLNRWKVIGKLLNTYTLSFSLISFMNNPNIPLICTMAYQRDYTISFYFAVLAGSIALSISIMFFFIKVSKKVLDFK